MPTQPLKQSFKVAAVQTVSTPDVNQNLAAVDMLIRQAAQEGAQLVLLPEYWPIMGMRDTDKVAHAEHFGSGTMQEFMINAAREYGIWLIGGTLPLASGVAGKVLITTLVYRPDGQCIVRYGGGRRGGGAGGGGAGD